METPVTTRPGSAEFDAPEDGPEKWPLIAEYAKILHAPFYREEEEKKALIRRLQALQKAMDGEEWRGTQENLDGLHEMSATVDVVLGYLAAPGGWDGWENLTVEVEP